MQSLECTDILRKTPAHAAKQPYEKKREGSSWYEKNHRHFSTIEHSQCLFNRTPAIVPGLRITFDEHGVLRGEFKCNGYQQGYDNMVHGGVIAAIIDASMAQCLMGHGIIGYTADLSVRYLKPVLIRTATKFETSITSVKRNLYSMRSTVTQNETCAIKAKGKFFRQNKAGAQ